MRPRFQFNVVRLLSSVSLVCLGCGLFRLFFTARPWFPFLAGGTIAICAAYLTLVHNIQREDWRALISWLALIYLIYTFISIVLAFVS